MSGEVIRVRSLASRLLPHNNRRCVAPPGPLPRGKGRPIVVASLMRSGTHLLVDLILNNFPAYRRSPLYVDADALFRSSGGGGGLAEVGSCIVKTHFPQLPAESAAEQALADLATQALVLQPVRSADATLRSLQRFGYRGDRRQLDAERQHWDAWWGRFAPVRFCFVDLASPTSSHEAVRQIARALGCDAPVVPQLTQSLEATGAVLGSKLLTRLLGRRAPRINTSIQFATTPRDSGGESVTS
jgi:hypothetical protein